jgi:hypothetical protein
MPYITNTRKQLPKLLTNRPLTSVGTSSKSSLALLADASNTAFKALPCVVKSVTPHQMAKATNAQKAVMMCCGAWANPPYRTMVKPIPDIMDTVNPGNTNIMSNNGTLSNQNVKTDEFLVWHAIHSMAVVKMIPPDSRNMRNNYLENSLLLSAFPMYNNNNNNIRTSKQHATHQVSQKEDSFVDMLKEFGKGTNKIIDKDKDTNRCHPSDQSQQFDVFGFVDPILIHVTTTTTGIIFGEHDGRKRVDRFLELLFLPANDESQPVVVVVVVVVVHGGGSIAAGAAAADLSVVILERGLELP